MALEGLRTHPRWKRLLRRCDYDDDDDDDDSDHGLNQIGTKMRMIPGEKPKPFAKDNQSSGNLYIILNMFGI